MTEERRSLLRSVAAWERQLAIRRTTVLGVTLWMAFRAMEWAGNYAMTTHETNGIEAAAVIAAVTAPVTYMLKAVFDTYTASK